MSGSGGWPTHPALTKLRGTRGTHGMVEKKTTKEAWGHPGDRPSFGIGSGLVFNYSIYQITQLPNLADSLRPAPEPEGRNSLARVRKPRVDRKKTGEPRRGGTL